MILQNNILGHPDEMAHKEGATQKIYVHGMCVYSLIAAHIFTNKNSHGHFDIVWLYITRKQNTVFFCHNLRLFWPLWVFVTLLELPPLAASRAAPHCGAQAAHCGGSCLEHRLWGVGSVDVARELSRSAAYGIFLDWESNPRSLH